jgi:hypothetical protein
MMVVGVALMLTQLLKVVGIPMFIVGLLLVLRALA